jgi:hypothetical protein
MGVTNSPATIIAANKKFTNTFFLCMGLDLLDEEIPEFQVNIK